MHSFDSSVVRLAIPKEYHEVSLASVALSKSAWLLLLGATVPSIIVCLWMTIVIFESKPLSSSYTLLKPIDLFAEGLACSIMQFQMSFEKLGFELKVAFSLAVFSKFLFLNILQGEVISFAHESRVPSSGCVYDVCEVRHVRTVLNSTFKRASQIFEASNDPRTGDIEPTRHLKGCSSSSKRMTRAHHSTALGNETLLAFLFLGGALCGKSDFMRIKVDSIKAQGLLLEEGLKLSRASTELCGEISVPWIQRRALENSLFYFAFFGMRSGVREPAESEREFWSSSEPKIRRRKESLLRNKSYLKQLYRKFQMWQSVKTDRVNLEALERSITLTTILFGASSAILVMEVRASRLLSVMRRLVLHAQKLALKVRVH